MAQCRSFRNQGGRYSHPETNASALAIHNGSFTAKEAGDYVFFASSGDRRKEIEHSSGWQNRCGSREYWTPYAITGVCNLPAGKAFPWWCAAEETE